MEVLNINEKYTAEEYPYGGKRTKAFFSVEFKPKKGFRTAFQTIKPGTDRLNSVQNSIYSHFIAIIKKGNGHFDWLHFNINGDESMVKTFGFIGEHYEELNLTKEMHHYMAAMALQSRAISMSFTKFSTDELKETYKQNFHNPFIQKVKLLLYENNASIYKEAVVFLKNGIEFINSNTKSVFDIG